MRRVLGNSRKLICSLLGQAPVSLAYYKSSHSKPSTPLSRFSSSFLAPISISAIRVFCSKSGEVGSMASSVQNLGSISYLAQREATEVDETLMGPLGFSVDQLMELAGLSVATSIAEVYKPSEYNRVLAICGPGNNGGDGLVAARHFYHFGYKPFVCYPKRTQKPLYSGLVTQLESLPIPFLSVDELPVDLSKDFDILVDAMFGFSFHGAPRPPFDELIQKLVNLHSYQRVQQKSPVIVSVDIPSGWHVEEGDVGGEGIKPDMLVSLTAPKLCAKKFSGPHHFLGGRFVPPTIAEKYKLCLPQYPGTSMCVRIGKPPQIDIAALRENYISPEFLEEHVEANPLDQFRKWFDDAVAAGLKEPNAMALSTAGKDGKLHGSTIGEMWALAPNGILEKIWELTKKCLNILKNFAFSSTKYDIHAYYLSSSRMVLLKGVDKGGFVWYTNYESRKARELSENPHAALLFYWDGLNRQVRVEGSVQKVSDEESEQYFHSRPRGSQIGAIVSKQSTVVPGRHVLHQQYKELEEKYSKEVMIPKPKHWGGYRLQPNRFEFWQGQMSRLHDRLEYSPQEIDGKRVWKIVRLAP
ncbi:NAD(P)H-hydrate epimerase [Hibiscus syriacus]|uniref:NAD(P)H-hydrate epimerase n=1 Tax=Hibiscus syriacus TaxID=106335 RepID=A0A6A2Y1I1_HIBSY|nr:NAD(P)H-hydrate epimerase [Hibiscus syriacus]